MIIFLGFKFMLKLRKSLIEEIIIKPKLDPSIKKLYTSKSKDLALNDLNNILLKLFEKYCERKFYLSSIDPGSGKTTLIYEFLKELDFIKCTAECSIVIFFNTIEEIKSFIAIAGLDYDDFAVWCSDSVLSSYGRGADNKELARILLTTQEKFRRYIRESFEKCEEFYFLGKPRSLRIWDESLLPATPRSIPMDEMVKLYAPLRHRWETFIKALEAVQTTVMARPTGELVEFPSFKDFPSPDQLKEIIGITDKHRDLVSDLTSLQGQRLEISKDFGGGKSIIGLIRRIPDDFAPAVILDGSGRLKATYSIWEKHKRNLVRLLSHNHDYSPLTIHHWNRASGKTELLHSHHREEILKHVAEVINRDREEWLIIHHKDDEKLKGYSLENELRKLVANPDRLHFRHWGLHKATNEFRDIKHVMVIGLMHYRESDYRAIYRAASGTKACAPIDKNDIGHLKRSEHQDHLLQAICRSNVRNVDEDGKCGDAVAYIIGKGTVNKGMLEETFPGCTVNTWEPVTKLLTGNAAKLIDGLRKRFSEGITSITKKAIREEIGVSASAFSELLKRKNVKKCISEDKIVILNKIFKKKE
ncbi:hypothetical protein [Sphingosinicella sp.]|uniref:hypothetical protein n=1 Tax=Sphingosinicella sp. TaxID=1917971 RepID=UPI0025E5CC57|nr:hypothetical protein [Sphingosinicella sp.]